MISVRMRSEAVGVLEKGIGREFMNAAHTDTAAVNPIAIPIATLPIRTPAPPRGSATMPPNTIQITFSNVPAPPSVAGNCGIGLRVFGSKTVMFPVEGDTPMTGPAEAKVRKHVWITTRSRRR